MGTSGTALARELPALVGPGVGVLDAPVMGSRAEAAEGRLTIFVGGAAADVERCAPVLAALGRHEHLGPAGAGASAKLVANLALLGSVALLREAVALGEGLGLSETAVLEALEVSPLAAQAGRRGPALRGDEGPTRFALALAAKDAGLAAVAAQDAGLRAPLTRATRTVYAEAAADGLGGRDYTAVLGHRRGA
jgi:3-hydroxyisobutyrate dehydrogenase-like beta-hydroxyacid dehydrogenase